MKSITLKFQRSGNLKLIMLAMIFAMTGMNLYSAPRIACGAGEKRNKNGKCVKASRVDKAHAKKKVENSSPMKATNNANNAINAYNKALTSTKPDPRMTLATQQAAIKAINNLIAVYNQYLEIVTTGKNAVGYVTQVFATDTTSTTNSSNKMIAPQNTMMQMNDSSQMPAYVSQCGDGSTAMCDDGSVITTLPCSDDTAPDANGVCSDGSLVICPQSGNSPICADGTYAW
ncbi:hypothetical protein KBC04_02015 [Candidatus Babeliales bacterium]|nr:hypothetical protein [Candidatus Babeliales bacterium]MBP9843815.1 hypothetical protein [Candidatus Babeliales bacterium]